MRDAGYGKSSDLYRIGTGHDRRADYAFYSAQRRSRYGSRRVEAGRVSPSVAELRQLNMTAEPVLRRGHRSLGRRARPAPGCPRQPLQTGPRRQPHPQEARAWDRLRHSRPGTDGAPAANAADKLGFTRIRSFQSIGHGCHSVIPVVAGQPSSCQMSARWDPLGRAVMVASAWQSMHASARP